MVFNAFHDPHRATHSNPPRRVGQVLTLGDGLILAVIWWLVDFLIILGVCPSTGSYWDDSPIPTVIESPGNGIFAGAYAANGSLLQAPWSAKGDAVFDGVTGGIIKFGERYRISGWAENDIVHKRPHQQNTATVRGFNVLIQRWIR